MNISIFGLGYVGCVGIGCLASEGHKIIGVDISEHKVNLINSGIPTIVEKGIKELISNGVKTKSIYATTSFVDAVNDSSVSFICVGTPNKSTGQLDLTFLYKVAEQIAEALVNKKTFHTVIIRSTVLPGTNETLAEFISEKSGKKNNVDFCVVSNPEFLREGTAVEDFFNPPMTVIGSQCDKGISIVKEIYVNIKAPVEVVDIRVAESIKLLNNTFHALKVAFANEVGMICKEMNINTHQLIDLFLNDTKLNISKAYLRPGFAYGGSCLPKDLLALKLIAHDNYIKTPIIDHIEDSNTYQIERLTKYIIDTGIKKIGVVGISFKDGTDDLRNSPIVKVIEILLGKGYEIKIYDKNVNLSSLIGANKEFIYNHLPHFEDLLYSCIEEVISLSDILIINTKQIDDIHLINENNNIKILDLVYKQDLIKHPNYNGFNW